MRILSGVKMADHPYSELFEPSNAVYTPSEVSAYGLELIESIRDRKDRAIGIGIPFLEDYFAPLVPGQVAGIVGQTSHYKSALLHLIEHKTAEQLVRQSRENEVVIHVSVEEGIEEQAFLEFARYGGEDAGKLARGIVSDWNNLVKVSYTIAGVPIFRIGDSIKRSEKVQQMHLSNVMKSIDFIQKEFKVTPAMITIDYLQALPLDSEYKSMDDDSQRRLQVRRDAYRIRQMSIRFNSPVWVACQAKQILANKDAVLIPGMYDIQESADVAQRFDRLIGVWLPARSYPVGTRLKIGGEEIQVTDDLFIIRVNKQRGGLPAGKIFVCRINYSNNSVESWG